MTIIFQIIVWLLLIYFTRKLTEYFGYKELSNPYVSISNFLFDKGVEGLANDVISGLVTLILFWLTVSLGLLYVVLSWVFIGWGFNLVGLG
jgi:hypothetical protein